MNAAPPWIEANQQQLAAEFARLRRLFGDADAAVPTPGPLAEPAAIDQLATLFGLSPFERLVLLLAAGVEMDSTLARLVPRPSFGLALGALPGAHWSALGPLAPLRAWRLVELEGAGPAEARLRIDERILHHLAGVNRIDARLAPLLRPLQAPALMAASHAAELQRLQALLASGPAEEPALQLVHLAGNDAEARRDIAAALAQALGRSALLLSAGDIPAAAADQEALAVLWQREAALLPALLFIDADDRTPDRHPGIVARFTARLAGPVLLAGRDAAGCTPLAGARIDRPGAAEQHRLWLQALADAPAMLRDTAGALAQQLRLSATQIERQAQLARHQARQQGVAPAAAQLWREAAVASGAALEPLAQAVDTRHASWDALVLPEAQLGTLRLLAAQVRQRQRVHGDWGFAASGGGQRGLGIAALFSGESGTGKTLACEVLAQALGITLLRIDLAGVVSKYIGETEKNLARVFDAAEASGALLLFDEADALFGKRSEVRDSHDRYANIEVSYLLQRMEAYGGLSVLTTNQRGSIDPAFLRRLRFVVHFPFPDEPQREQLWRLVLPPAMPRQGLDLQRLARARLTGGQIRNIALNAAFLAADADEPVTMAHLAQAAQFEAAKQERPMADVQTRGWVA